MAFNATLADRIRAELGTRAGLTEKQMFGGIAFLLQGNVCCGVRGDEMIVRLDPEQTEKTLAEKGTRIFDITGRPMKGWILVSASALTPKSALSKWVRRGVAYAGSLPPK